MVTEYAFPRSVRRFGKLGLLGLLVFGSSIIVLHLIGSDIDLTGHYVSNLANMPFGWIFMSGAFVHGWGNLALTMGLHGLRLFFYRQLHIAGPRRHFPARASAFPDWR